jgi:hypothetical protein
MLCFDGSGNFILIHYASGCSIPDTTSFVPEQDSWRYISMARWISNKLIVMQCIDLIQNNSILQVNKEVAKKKTAFGNTPFFVLKVTIKLPLSALWSRDSAVGIATGYGLDD